MWFRWLKNLIPVGVLLWLIVFLVLPMSAISIRAFVGTEGEFAGFYWFSRYLSTPNLWSSASNSLYVASWSTLISVSLATVVALGLERSQMSGKRLVGLISQLPLYAPTMLLGICLIYLFGQQGFMTSLGFSLPLYGPVGIIMAESIFCFPIALMLIRVSLAQSDQRLYEAARSMDASSIKIFFTVTMPSMRYGFMSALALCFTYSFTDFGAPSVIGGNYNVIATDVFKQVIGQQNFNMGAVVGLVMLLPSLGTFFLTRYLDKKQHAQALNAKPLIIERQPIRDKVFTVVGLGVVSALGIFFAIALFASLITFWPYNLNFSLEHYDFTRTAGGMGHKALFNSMQVALMTAVLGSLLAYMSAYWIEKINPESTDGIFNRGIKSLVKGLALAPMAIPGTVMGLGYILFFNQRFIPIPSTDLLLVNPLNGIYGTAAILVFCNIAHYFSVPFLTATTALKQLNKELETVGSSLGVPQWRTFLRVTLPMTSKALGDMMIYLFINGMITVSAVVFIYQSRMPISSVMILNLKDSGDMARAAAMSVLVLFINVFVKGVYWLLVEGIGRHRANIKSTLTISNEKTVVLSRREQHV